MENFNSQAYKDKILQSKTLKSLEDIHIELFSKNGFFSKAMSNMGSLSVEEKKEKGRVLNQSKEELLKLFLQVQNQLQIDDINNKMLAEKLDLSLPSINIEQGLLHPLTYSQEKIVNIFANMGFKINQANDIEEDWYNFTALNIQPSHPSRQEHDTFYLNMLDSQGVKKVLRTHTSNVQIRTMMELTQNKTKEFILNEPLQIIAPGRTYRSDSDSTHSPMFHQIEGLYIDKIENVSIAYLKSILNIFCEQYFEIKNLPLRFRSSYFPFTSPSFEVDIQCNKKDNQLILGEGKDWLEVLGCGIINVNVLENCGIDPTKYSGFAFGMGLERLTMLKGGFRDLRSFYLGDIRWLKYYGLSSVKIPTNQFVNNQKS